MYKKSAFYAPRMAKRTISTSHFPRYTFPVPFSISYFTFAFHVPLFLKFASFSCPTIFEICQHILAISPKSNKNVTDFFIKLDGTVISVENSAKYLGINLDLSLNFRKHIEVIENKLSRSLAILFKLKPVLPQNALLKL